LGYGFKELPKGQEDFITAMLGLRTGGGGNLKGKILVAGLGKNGGITNLGIQGYH